MDIKRFLKTLCVTTLVFANCIAAVGCKDGTGTSGNQDNKNNVNLWTASGIEKILQGTDYTDRYSSKTLEIAAFRSESEAGQIIITPEKDVEEYTVELSDLVLTSDSSVKLSKDNFEIFHQKYVNLTVIKATVATGGGYYPDALLPYEKAVEYDENKIAAGKNQGLWITVLPDAQQEPGVYTGNFKICLDGDEHQVPVEVTVFGHVLSDETHLKSWYGLNWSWMGRAELDSTMEMQYAYNEYFLERRINPGYLPGTFYNTINKPYKEIPHDFLDEAVKATKDPRRSFYCIPYETTAVTDDMGVSRVTLDLAYYKKVLEAMTQRSVEEGVDLFKKGGLYLVWLDEYSAWGKEENTAYTLDYMWGTANDFADELEDTLECDNQEFKSQLLESIRNIIVFIPGDPYALEPYLEKYPNAKLVPCNTTKEFNSEEYRKWLDKYIETAYGEKWLYTAGDNYPRTCYLTEAPLISARLNGWMLYDHDVAGDLFWETVYYHVKGEGQSVEYVQDQFSVGERQPNYNGEGQLIYPGREYGIQGPIGTVRFEALRDTHEEYDLLYELEALYRAKGVTADEFDSIVEYMSKDLYLGVTWLEHKDSIKMVQANRRLVAALFDLVEGNGIVLHGLNMSLGKMVAKISAPMETVVSVNGNTLQSEDTENGLSLYTYTLELNQENNYLNIEGLTGTIKNSVNIYLGGKAVAYDRNSVQTCATANGGTLTMDESIGCVKLEPNDNADSVSIKLDVADWNIDKNRDSISIRVYVYGTESIELSLAAKMKNSRAVKNIGTKTLTPGWNEIQISVVADLKCDTNGALEYLTFSIESGSMANFGIDEIVVMG